MSQPFYNKNYDFYLSENQIKRKTLSKVFLHLTLSLIISYVSILLISVIVGLIPSVPKWFSLVVNDFYTVLVIVIFLIFSRKISSRRPIAVSDMTSGKFILYICVSVPIMLLGSLIGIVFSKFIGNILGRDLINIVETVVQTYPSPLVFISVVLVAPLFEELMFRKLLIDKLSTFGSGVSIIISGLVFGTFHGNFYQMFYAIFLGCVLAFIYCAYGKIHYCILLHAIINFMGIVGSMFLSEFVFSDNIFLRTIAACYSLLYYLCLTVGIAAIVHFIKNFKAKYSLIFRVPVPSLIFKNFGFVFYLGFSLILFIINFFV